MKIFVAKDAGYCFGVRDAVNLAYDTADKHGEVYMLGTVVHNERVVANLEKVGTKVVDSLDDIPKDKPVLFRAHGTPPNIWEEAKRKNLNLIDATCPLVVDIHHEIKKLEEEGRKTIIIGDHGHDEVSAIAAQVSYPIIISNISEANNLRKMKNSLENIVLSKYSKLKAMKLFLENISEPNFVRMTGSGSALVAYFQSKERCDNAKKQFNKKYKNYWCIASKTI